MATKDTRRQFDEIVGRLAAEDPAIFTRPGRRLPRRGVLVALAIAGAVLWGALSVLMVVWGAVGVLITCFIVAVAISVAIVLSRPDRP
ncbi:hypothetical protein [Actinoplanes sp. GCM10030250]|uniref:hypothetical protein n=1 Tax=Actinoplanes sp. GCM10030250 TaxID=3273376 RepID=UPI00361E9C1B